MDQHISHLIFKFLTNLSRWLQTVDKIFDFVGSFFMHAFRGHCLSLSSSANAIPAGDVINYSSLFIDSTLIKSNANKNKYTTELAKNDTLHFQEELNNEFSK